MHIFRWDLDKTYLQTDFDSIRGLVKSALQSAEEKQNVPGTAALMRELRAGATGRENSFHVVSGSPRQMRRVLARKLLMDGARIDSLTLKPNLRNVLRLRFRAVRDQLGYKLPTLLEARAGVADAAVRETCFGDDAEMDALVYRLYTDICAGRVDAAGLRRILDVARLYQDQVDRTLAAASAIRTAHDPVQRILIHLDRGSPTGRFDAFGPRVVPTFNTFQAALVLHNDEHLTVDGVAAIADEMLVNYNYTRQRLAGSLEDTVRRHVVPHALATATAERLGLALPTPPATPASPLSDTAPVDYVKVLGDIHAWHKERKAKRAGLSISRLLGRD